ncbi:MAG TPA: response regulator transcription factor [Thermoanaerobaculia bacterium]
MNKRGRSILVVDDDRSILSLLTAELRAEGYETLEATDGDKALALLAEQPDLILTDLAMPVMDGFELIARVRRQQKIPIVVLSVRGSESDKIRALDLGADDYVVKPPSIPELLARLRAQLRRTAPPGELRFPDLTIDLQCRKVVQGGRELKLTPTEFALLELFATHAGKPLFFEQIIQNVWQGASATSKDTVRVHVASLRRKLEPDPSNPRYLVSEPWIGYRFIAEPL